MTEIKYLASGDPVLVVGEAPVQNTSTDGGATLTQVAHTFVSRLDVEAVDSSGLYDSAEAAAEARTPAEPEADTTGGAVPGRGDAQNADELQAQIDRLTAENEALKSGKPDQQ